MATVRMRGTARTAFGHLSQGGLLKPTALWDLMSPVINDFWPAATGRTGNAYLEATDCRTLLMQLLIERRPVPVPDEHDLAVEIDTPMGALRADGRPPRFGGVDHARFLDPARAEGDQVVAAWTGWWLWFRAGDDGAMALLHEPAPDLIVEQDETLPEAERPPTLLDPVSLPAFRWTARETDTNDHVFSLSYLERAENALADQGVDTSELHQWRTWWLRPSFLGERMRPEVQAVDDHWLVGLRNLERDEISAVVRTGGA